MAADVPDDAGCTVLHVDMDAFYASVEVRRRPELKGRPVVVGGTGPRGVVSSASYEARAYGVRSAMPGGMARRLCPQAVFLAPDMPAYAEASREVMGIFADVTPLVEPLSIDEAFLDVAGAVRRLGSPTRIAQTIKRRIAEELRLTCTVGVASTKFVAKLASTQAKPDGLLVVPVAGVLEFLHPLPVEALWGVGDRTAEVLRRLGLRTVGDVASVPVGMLRSALGEAAAKHLHELSWARDPRPVIGGARVEKSIGAEVTYDTDVSDSDTIRRTLLSLANRVGARLRHSAQAGRTVSIKVRLADFTTLTRSRTLPAPTDVAREIFAAAWGLFAQLAERTSGQGAQLAKRTSGRGAQLAERTSGRGAQLASSAGRPGARLAERTSGRGAQLAERTSGQGAQLASSAGRPGARLATPAGRPGEAVSSGLKIRLLGVRVEGLEGSDGLPRQLALDGREHGWREAEVAADAAAARFGATVVRPASLLRRAEQENPVGSGQNDQAGVADVIP